MKKEIEEDPGCEYNDGTGLVFLSSLPGQKGTVSDGLREFLDFVNGGEGRSELTRKIGAAVRRAISQKEWRKEYMILEEMREDCRAEVYEDIVTRMREKGKSDEEISDLIGLSKEDVAAISSAEK